MAGAGSEEFGIGEWLTYYGRKQVVKIHAGLISMRRRTGANWLRFDDQPILLDTPAGETVARGFDAWDALQTLSDEALLERRPILEPGTQLLQVSSQQAGGWQLASSRLQLAGPLLRDLDIDQLVARFLGRCDGSRTLQELVQQLAQESGIAPERVAPEALAITRKLLAQGFLAV